VSFNSEIFEVQGGRKLSGELPMFIGGTLVHSVGGATVSLVNPATGRELTRTQEACLEDVDLAVDAASQVFTSGTWRNELRKTRAEVLHHIADLIHEFREQIYSLETLNNGRPIRETRAQLSILGDYFRYAASVLLTHRDDVIPSDGGHHVYTHRTPIGVCAIITPFNHPMLILGQSLPFALAAGNSVIVKPSELTPITTVFLALLASDAGLPPGVFNVITGGPEVSKALVSDRRVAKVNFTGGNRGGRAIAELTSTRSIKLTTELGGHSPVVVFEDADIESAVNGVTFASFIASGQTCIAASRVLVQSSIHEEFLTRLSSKVKSLRVGDPTLSETDVGPVISAASRDKVLHVVESAVLSGATLVTGGKAVPGEGDCADGFFLDPVVIAQIDPTSDIVSEEVFGPLIMIMPFKDEEEAIALANESEFALGAAVWTSDIGRGHRVAAAIESGICWVNDHHRLEVSVPWGGYGESGVGKEAGLEAFKDFTNQRVVIVRTERQSTDWYTSDDLRLN
jgi:acyl-CoA reductase-like NAD-dependent aldehyde dehydrogenase